LGRNGGGINIKDSMRAKEVGQRKGNKEKEREPLGGGGDRETGGHEKSWDPYVHISGGVFNLTGQNEKKIMQRGWATPPEAGDFGTRG